MINAVKGSKVANIPALNDPIRFVPNCRSAQLMMPMLISASISSQNNPAGLLSVWVDKAYTKEMTAWHR